MRVLKYNTKFLYINLLKEIIFIYSIVLSYMFFKNRKLPFSMSQADAILSRREVRCMKELRQVL